MTTDTTHGAGEEPKPVTTNVLETLLECGGIGGPMSVRLSSAACESIYANLKWARARIAELEVQRDAARAEADAAKGRDMDDLQRRIGEWQRATFPNPTGSVLPTVRHLIREANELLEGAQARELTGGDAWSNAKIAEEAADVAMLAFGVAEIVGVSLRGRVDWKLEVNRGRTWGEPDGEGVREHTKDDDPSRPSDGAGEGEGA